MNNIRIIKRNNEKTNIEKTNIIDLIEGDFFEFNNELYIKAAHISSCINISKSKEMLLEEDTIIYPCKNIEIKYNI